MNTNVSHVAAETEHYPTLWSTINETQKLTQRTIVVSDVECIAHRVIFQATSSDVWQAKVKSPILTLIYESPRSVYRSVVGSIEHTTVPGNQFMRSINTPITSRS